MKNKNGFTLIELLAVIVILALIAVIASPLIIGVIEDARKGTAKNSVYGALDSVKSHYTESLLTSSPLALPITVDFSASPASGTIAGSALSMSGTKPTAGKVTLTVSGKYCVGTYTAASGNTAENCSTNGTITANGYNCTYDWAKQEVTDCSKAS